MAVSKFSFLIFFLLCSYAHSQQKQAVKIDSLVDGCFTLRNLLVDTTKDPVLATASIKYKTETTGCPCKSAVVKYSVAQEKDGDISNLLSGQFSILGKENIVLPIAVQKQLIFPGAPLELSLSCSND